MPYELRLSPGTQASIRAYVRRRVPTGQRSRAVSLILAELKKLAANPHGIKQPRLALRPFWIFTIRLDDGVIRPIRVTFRFDEDEIGISILEFAPQRF